MATSSLSALLKERGSRQLFFRAGGVAVLKPLLQASNSPTNSQLLYELCLCTWQMTFVKEAAESMSKSGRPSASLAGIQADVWRRLIRQVVND